MKLKSKFKIDDIVYIKDEFHFNPADGALSVGKIEAIHFKTKKGMFKGEDVRGTVYSITGFSLRPKEEELELIELA